MKSVLRFLDGCLLNPCIRGIYWWWLNPCIKGIYWWWLDPCLRGLNWEWLDSGFRPLTVYCELKALVLITFISVDCEYSCWSHLLVWYNRKRTKITKIVVYWNIYYVLELEIIDKIFCWLSYVFKVLSSYAEPSQLDLIIYWAYELTIYF